MTKPNLLELAKQGDEQAIAAVINYLLKDKFITAKANLKDGHLRIMLQSSQVPEQKSSVDFIQKLMAKLAVKSIKFVTIYGRAGHKRSASWHQSLDLSLKAESAQKQSHAPKTISQNNLKNKQDFWPVWIPYPGSWIRALILAAIAFCVARLIILLLMGSFLSIVTKNSSLLILLTLAGILLSTAILSILYHFLWFRWEKPKFLLSWFKWWEGSNSGWEGLYATFLLGFSFLIIIAGVGLLVLANCHLSLTEAGVTSQRMLYRCTGHGIGIITRIILDSIENFWDFKGSGVLIIQEDSFQVRNWFKIWLIISAYLYQIEYLIRRRFTLGRLAKNLLIGILSFGTIIIITSSLKILSEIPAAFNIPTVSRSPVIATPKLPSASPTVENITPDPEQETFRKAVNTATNAAKLTQLAKSKNDWNKVVIAWKEAIDLMESISNSSPNYQVAQKKIGEYNRYLKYATAATSKLK